MNYVGRMSEQVNDNMKAEKIQEFNAKFTGYADRGEFGYAGKQDAISVQEFTKLYNLVKDWNTNNESDQIKIIFRSNNDGILNIKENINDINSYIKAFKPTSEQILADYFKGNTLDYYIEFKSDETKYENTGGRISSITLRMKKIKT